MKRDLPLPVLCFLFCCFSARRGEALSPEDQAFAGFLIKELRYFDTAQRWLTSIEKQGRLDPRDHADISSYRIDILQAQGKKADAEAAIAEHKKKFPSHWRTSVGSLEIINNAVNEVLSLYDKSAAQSDRAKAEGYRAQAVKTWLERVEKPLESLIAELDGRVKALKPDDKAYDRAVQARDQAELSRVKGCLVYARKLAAGSPERKIYLEAGLRLADEFVENRADYPVMQYEGQLHRGFFAYELGDLDQAEERLGVLYDIAPPFEPPYAKPLVDAFKGIRLQAILFGARCLIQSKSYKKAADTIEHHFLKPTKDAFDLSKTEDDPGLRRFAVLVRLEYGVALAGNGKAQPGLEEIQKVIARFRDDPGPEAQGFVTDGRKAFGRVATMGKVALRAKDYYEAAIGLKSELKLEEAIDAFQTALSSLNPRNVKERNVLAPLCLNEIGEISFLLGRHAEAAVAYAEVVEYFPEAEGDLISKVAQNYLAAVTKAIDSTGGGSSHAGLAKLREQATAFYDRKGEGLGSVQAIMVEARKLEEAAKFDEAREKYLEVPEALKMQKVPFYWRAQASAWGCLFRKWERADDAGRKELEDEIAAMIEALSKIVPQAILDEDKAGAATAALTLGQVHYHEEEWGKAVEALKPFDGELASEAYFRCPGLGYLVLAEVRTGALKEAKGRFLRLRKDCKDEPVVAYAAAALADGFETAGDAKSAAVMELIYLSHPSSKEDLKKIEILVAGVQRLIDGGLIKQAQTYIDRVKKLGKAGDPQLERRFLLLDVRVLVNEKKWDEAIAAYEGYIKKFVPRGENYEDPFVFMNLAEALIQRAGKPAQLKDMIAADRNYSTACALMQQRMQAAPKDAKSSRTFWTWMLRYLRIKKFLGDSGEVNAYHDLVLFVNENKHTDMGGLKEELLKLGAEAEEKLGGKEKKR